MAGVRRAVVTLLASTILVLAVGLLATAPRAFAAAGDCTDSFDCLSLDTQFNNSQPFTRSQNFDLTTDMTGYTLQSGERASCILPGNAMVRYGDDSAWYRFDAGVAGTLAVTADTTLNGTAAGFNVLMLSYHASHEGAIDYTSTTDLRNDQCSSEGKSVSLDSPANIPVYTNGPTFVQVLVWCGDAASGNPSPCPADSSPATSSPAGQIAMHFSFTATDSDGDGVPDTLDQCPTIYGATASGCPAPPPPPPVADSDGDGVPDVLDKCPLVPGPAKFAGCPDSDGDGIPDDIDACPTQAGPAEANGCPDADGDGIPDSKDKCPTEFAVVGFSSYGDGRLGCPEPLASFVDSSYTVSSRYVNLTSLKGTYVPPNAVLKVTCTGHGCPKHNLVSVVAKKATVNLLPALLKTKLARGGKLLLPNGLHLTTAITLRGTLGRVSTLVATGLRGPRFIEACENGTKVVACPQ